MEGRSSLIKGYSNDKTYLKNLDFCLFPLSITSTNSSNLCINDLTNRENFTQYLNTIGNSYYKPMYFEVIEDSETALIPLSANEQFEKINRFFNLSVTKWTNLFNVSRLTIYSWLKKETEPTGNNLEKITSLFKLINSLSEEIQKKSIFRGLLNENITRFNKSLLEIISAPNAAIENYEALKEVIIYLVGKSNELENFQTKNNKSKKSSDAVFYRNLENL